MTNNSLCPVVEEGSVNVEIDAPNVCGIFLEDVYHVPYLKKNLVSVSQITDSMRYILFGPNDVKIISNIKQFSANFLLTRKRKDSLYILSPSDVYIKKTGQNGSVSLCHTRLSHVGYHLLQRISTKKLCFFCNIPLLKDLENHIVFLFPI